MLLFKLVNYPSICYKYIFENNFLLNELPQGIPKGITKQQRTPRDSMYVHCTVHMYILYMFMIFEFIKDHQDYKAYRVNDELQSSNLVSP
jgi:hypothetical protein